MWDDENTKWWFSVLDIVGAINGQDDCSRTRNYWKYLKTNLRKQGSELVSLTNQLKLLAADGKRYMTDVLDYNGALLLAESIPNKNSTRFVHWLDSDKDSIDGKSCEKAYAMWDSGLMDSVEIGTYVEMNVAHPFMEGNGRGTRLWVDLLLKNRFAKCVDRSRIAKRDNMNAMVLSATDATMHHGLSMGALTDKVDDCETFTKGVDYS